jgi:hypothetical protein
MNETVTKARVGVGNVTIQIGGHDYELVPTYHAASNISRLSGGLRGAIQGVSNLDFDVIGRVVQFGLGPKTVKDLGGANKLNELIYGEGLTDGSGEFAGKCVEFLTVLSNGGKPLTSRAEDEPGEH